MAWATERHGASGAPVPVAEPQGATCLTSRPPGAVTAGKVHPDVDLGAAGKTCTGMAPIDESTGRAPTPVADPSGTCSGGVAAAGDAAMPSPSTVTTTSVMARRALLRFRTTISASPCNRSRHYKTGAPTHEPGFLQMFC